MGMQHLWIHRTVEPFPCFLIVCFISLSLSLFCLSFSFLCTLWYSQPCQIDFVLQPHAPESFTFFFYSLFFYQFRIVFGISTKCLFNVRNSLTQWMNFQSKPKTFIRLMHVWFYSELICFTPLRQIVYRVNSETHSVKNQPNAIGSVLSWVFGVCGICQFFVYLLNRNVCGCTGFAPPPPLPPTGVVSKSPAAQTSQS